MAIPVAISMLPPVKADIVRCPIYIKILFEGKIPTLWSYHPRGSLPLMMSISLGMIGVNTCLNTNEGSFLHLILK
jgi:hypothetical protein